MEFASPLLAPHGTYGTPRGFVPWASPTAAAGSEWWPAPPSATAGASGWTPLAAAMRSAAARATPPFLRDRWVADAAADDVESATARWANVSSASTQVRFLTKPRGSWARLLVSSDAVPAFAGQAELRAGVHG